MSKIFGCFLEKTSRVVMSHSLVFTEWKPETCYYWDLIEDEYTNFILFINFRIHSITIPSFGGTEVLTTFQEAILALTYKLLTYWTTPFSKIFLGMKIDNQLRFIVINQQADTLHSLIADGKYRNTSKGRDTWKTPIGSQASLQPHCNKEVFNAAGDSPRLSKTR